MPNDNRPQVKIKRKMPVQDLYGNFSFKASFYT